MRTTIIGKNKNMETNYPTVQASNLIFTNITRVSMTVKCTRGDGDGIVLLGRERYAIPSNPLTDGVSWEGLANSDYTLAPTVNDAKVLYCGTSNSVDVTGLLRYKLYSYHVCEYKIVDGVTYYLQTDALGNPRNRWTLR